MSGLFYPRLPDAVAASVLAELSGLQHADLMERSALAHRASYFYPTRTAEVTLANLRELQAAVREVAVDCGYPTSGGKGTPALREFDQRCCRLLFERMDIVVADAASDEVWSFLSLVLLPDVAFWRFPNQREREDYERLLGRPRNVFRRLWWRAHNIGTELGPQLLEDEAVGILERSTIGGNPVIARGIASEHLRRVKSDVTVQRTELLRDVMKRIRRIAAIVSLGGIDPADLEALISEAFDASTAALAAPG
ncbi:DUF6339 family protein [Nakamurella lactea]|uniref:DUF6339 family protein n=1 Tax=Nakamurella lactea TaxID=459515 RepID=UPI00048EE26A|nr:DUF6339 family protein [Nakamurella lactea]